MVNRLWKGVRYWAQAFLIPIYGLSHLFPRDKKIWLCGTTFGRRWADNGRYFYLYLHQFKREEVRPIWITHKKEIAAFLQEKGYEAYYYHSLKGIWFCLRGGVYIYDNYSKDISFWLSGGALKVNLWHGSGNKKTNFDNKFDYLRHPRSAWERFCTAITRMSNEKPWHYTVATSPMMAEIFISAFRTDMAHILQNGYPRNDVLFQDNKLVNVLTLAEQENLDHVMQAKDRGMKILTYMPTFRDSERLFFDVMDLEEFNAFLARENLLFLAKMHPKSKMKEAFSRISYSNIRSLDAEIDPYTFLGQVDLLVTDYSSIYSDYLMLNRPSVLFPFDFEEYSRDTRECYFTYDEYMPEIRAYTMPELMEDICLVLREDTYEAGRLALRDRIFAEADGRASERLYEKIRRLAFKN